MNINVVRIITHPGLSHMDDFLATCIVASLNPKADICRRDPTQEELNNPKIAVIDVGGDFNVELNNYDHHTLGDPTLCALDLVLIGLDIREEAQEAWGWLSVVSMQDNLGIKHTSHHMGVDPGAYLKISGPLGRIILKKFANDTDGSAALVREIGDELLSGLEFRKARTRTLKARESTMVFINGHRIIDMRGFDSPSAMLYEVFGSSRPRLIIGDSMRGKRATIKSELTIGGPNLLCLANDADVQFCHSTGFFIDLHEDVDPFEVIKRIPAKIK